MARTVADDLWEILVGAGIKRVYGIVGDALNPVMEALARHDEIEFIHVRNEEWGTFAASAEAFFSGGPVAVCGTAGPGVTHLLNGLIDCYRERSPVVVIAGDVETAVMDQETIEGVNPKDLFVTASLYTGRAINATQARDVFQQAVRTAIEEQGPTVIALPGDVAGSKSPSSPPKVNLATPAKLAAQDVDVAKFVELIDAAEKVSIFGGDGCRDAHDEVVALATKLKAPVGFSLKGKQWLERDNPNAVGMTGLLGYGGCFHAMKSADLIVMLGTDFPFPQFLEAGGAKVVQVDTNGHRLGRRTPLAAGALCDVATFCTALTDRVAAKTDSSHLDHAVAISERWEKRLGRYATEDSGDGPIRPEYLASLLNELMDDDALVTVDTGTPVLWTAHHIKFTGDRRMYGSFNWASMACAAPNAFGAAQAFPGRQVVAMCGDGGFTMLALGDLITAAQHNARIVHVVFHNDRLAFVDIEQQEFGMVPFGTDMPTPDLAKVAEALGVKGIRVEDPKDLRSALTEALAHKDGPVVLDVMTDPSALAVPSHVPGETAAGFTLSVAKRVLRGDLDEVLHEAGDNYRLL